MVRVECLGPMSEYGVREVEASTLKELKTILSDDKDLNKWLPIVAVAVNDEVIDNLAYPLRNGDRISLLPPVCGG